MGADASVKHPRVLELAGLAGAGKSSLSHVLGHQFNACCAGLGVYGLSQLHLARNVVRLLPLGVTLCGHRAFSDERIRQVVRLRTLLEVVNRESAKPWRMIVMDEGPVFALSWLDVFCHSWKRGFQRWRKQAIQQWAAKLDTIVWLDAPNRLLANRIRDRAKKHPLKDKSDRDVLDFLSRFRAAYERIISELTAEAGPKVIRFATDRYSTQEIADHLLERLTAERRQCQPLV